MLTHDQALRVEAHCLVLVNMPEGNKRTVFKLRTVRLVRPSTRFADYLFKPICSKKKANNVSHQRIEESMKTADTGNHLQISVALNLGRFHLEDSASTILDTRYIKSRSLG